MIYALILSPKSLLYMHVFVRIQNAHEITLNFARRNNNAHINRIINYAHNSQTDHYIIYQQAQDVSFRRKREHQEQLD